MTTDEPTEKTAAILAIGDELLSGRTRDANIHYLAGRLVERGVPLREARIVPDAPDVIAAALNELRARFSYVFTSGGIGPTHDDLTVDAVALAFGVDVVEDPRALKALEDWYGPRGEEVTPARRRMARMPVGAALIDNAASGAPGARLENVFVMAGVPRIFQAMFGVVEEHIAPGAPLHAFAITAPGLPESALAEQLRAIQSALKGVSIGSYPIDGDEKGVTVIVRSLNEDAARAAVDSIGAAMRALGVTPREGDHHD